jgi:hypothetical protein
MSRRNRERRHQKIEDKTQRAKDYRPLAVLENTAAPGARRCEGCSVCCTVLGVEKLGKPPDCTCVHVTAAGCGIYATRPQVCRQYLCSWLLGLGQEGDRPDRSGVLVALDERDGEFLIDFREIKTGAILAHWPVPRVVRLVTEVTRRLRVHPVVNIIRFGTPSYGKFDRRLNPAPQYVPQMITGKMTLYASVNPFFRIQMGVLPAHESDTPEEIRRRGLGEDILVYTAKGVQTHREANLDARQWMMQWSDAWLDQLPPEVMDKFRAAADQMAALFSRGADAAATLT